jgi:predicted amidohydrolase
MRVAAVQMAAIPINVEGGLDAIRSFASEATSQGAELVVFPELLVPGYPRYVPDPFPSSSEGQELWTDFQQYFRAYVDSACVIPGSFTDALAEISSSVRADLLVGVAERHPTIRAALWNTAVMISRDRGYVGKHRKLVSVMHEKLWFQRGGRDDLVVFDTSIGRVAPCICFENHHPLIRRALGRLGAEIHCALWTSPAPRDMAQRGEHLEQHRELGVAQALDTSTWVVIASQVTPRIPPGGEHGSLWAHSGGSYVIDPLGRTVAQVPNYEEGLALADVDLSLIDTARLIWHPFGDDVRDDLFGPGALPFGPAALDDVAPAGVDDLAASDLALDVVDG